MEKTNKELQEEIMSQRNAYNIDKAYNEVGARASESNWDNFRNLNTYTGFCVTIKNKDSTISVEDASYEEAVIKVVKWAIDENWKPKLHWWQIWMDEWPMGAKEEYIKQTS